MLLFFVFVFVVSFFFCRFNCNIRIRVSDNNKYWNYVPAPQRSLVELCTLFIIIAGSAFAINSITHMWYVFFFSFSFQVFKDHSHTHTYIHTQHNYTNIALDTEKKSYTEIANANLICCFFLVPKRFKSLRRIWVIILKKTRRKKRERKTTPPSPTTTTTNPSSGCTSWILFPIFTHKHHHQHHRWATNSIVERNSHSHTK